MKGHMNPIDCFGGFIIIGPQGEQRPCHEGDASSDARLELATLGSPVVPLLRFLLGSRFPSHKGNKPQHKGRPWYDVGIPKIGMPLVYPKWNTSFRKSRLGYQGHGLHIALMFGGGGSPERISVLLEAKADVNEQFRVKFRETGWWLMLNVMGLRHRVSPSRLTLLAYHHHDATPLMFSILAGSFEAVPCLLDAGARADVQNYRRQKTSDLARQVHAPAWLIEACSDERQRTGVRLDTESDSFFI